MTSKTASRMVRLLSMVPWVIANPGTAAEEVVARFGYRDERELLADLNTVLVCGLPGYGPGDLMWASIEDGDVVIDAADYFSRPLRLTPMEALGLLASGLAVESTGQAPDALGSAVAKLQAALIPDGDDVLVVDVEAEPELLAPLRRAVAERRAVRLTYTSLGKGETTERTVEPWTLFATMGNWYLTGFCREAGAERRFRVDRIRDLEVTDEVFPAPAQLPPPEVRYTPAEDDVVATIRLRAAGALGDRVLRGRERVRGAAMAGRWSGSPPRTRWWQPGCLFGSVAPPNWSKATRWQPPPKSSAPPSWIATADSGGPFPGPGSSYHPIQCST